LFIVASIFRQYWIRFQSFRIKKKTGWRDSMASLSNIIFSTKFSLTLNSQ
jgi:hypothetical protein